jgi:ABC-type phosphate transport system substrate-binding protein
MQRDDQTKGRRAMLLLVPCGLALLSTPLLSMPRRALAAASPAPGFRLIVHPDVGELALERAFVADIFLKKATRWPNGEPVAAVDLRFGSSVRQVFSERVLQRSASAVRHYWQQRIFTGRGVPPPELDSDDAVVRYVQSRRGAVGYVSETAATGAVKVVVLR